MGELTVHVSQVLLEEMDSIPVSSRGGDRSPFLCPLQRAIVRELGPKARYIEVTVWRDEIRLRNCRYDETYVNPEWVRLWMDRWDNGAEVPPITVGYKDPKMRDRADWSRIRPVLVDRSS